MKKNVDKQKNTALKNLKKRFNHLIIFSLSEEVLFFIYKMVVLHIQIIVITKMEQILQLKYINKLVEKSFFWFQVMRFIK
jgi:hypothetical protein